MTTPERLAAPSQRREQRNAPEVLRTSLRNGSKKTGSGFNGERGCTAVTGNRRSPYGDTDNQAILAAFLYLIPHLMCRFLARIQPNPTPPQTKADGQSSPGLTYQSPTRTQQTLGPARPPALTHSRPCRGLCRRQAGPHSARRRGRKGRTREMSPRAALPI
ncbi:hypothetical protein SKAU_G00123280 [Synaphobranchus kaupii]|uniref:Uncharacterized protein n=1 Tax=Synaphobranchus kaupii TaxID=118154 RepID=A0A9Q1J0H7_SYNKA|nr:hypothetical protein SKAU_G00123280 [Synaphobranchus kaupii]